MAQKPAPNAETIGVLLVCVVAVAFAGEDRGCHARGRVDARALCICKGADVGRPV